MPQAFTTLSHPFRAPQLSRPIRCWRSYCLCQVSAQPILFCGQLPDPYGVVQPFQSDQRPCQHQDMHPIVALPEQVERLGIPSLRYSGCIHSRPREVDQRQRQKGRQAHHWLEVGSKSKQAVYHRGEKACAEEAIHQESDRPIFWPSELGPERVDCTAKSSQGEKRKVDVAQGMMTIEGKMCPGHACAPHHEHNAEVV